MSNHGPFDPDELVRWAEPYGEPEEWAKKAQALHGQNEILRDALREVREALLNETPDLCEPQLDAMSDDEATWHAILHQAIEPALRAKGT